MAIKTKYSKIFSKIWNVLKILLAHSIDPLSFSLIRQIVFEQQSVKVFLSKMKTCGSNKDHLEM